MSRATPASLTLVGLLTAASNADSTLISVSLPGGNSAVGAYTLASVYGQSTTLDALSAGPTALDPGFLCVEANDLGPLGDLNHDRVVSSADLVMLLSAWGSVGSARPEDLNRDGTVGNQDLAILLQQWTT